MLSVDTSRRQLTSIAVVGAMLGACGTAMAVPQLHNLGLLPGGAYSTRGVVAGNGTTVTAFGDTSNGGPSSLRSFRWTVASGITHVVPLGDARGGAIGRDGFAISGGSGLAGSGFFWSIPSGVTLLNPLGGHLTCSTLGVSNGSAFICGSSSPVNTLSHAGRRAVRWNNAGVPTNLGIVAGASGVNPGSEASGISADGSVVVGWSEWTTAVFARRAFRWQAPAGPMVNLGTLPGGNSSEAWAVSSDNGAITGISDSGAAINRYRAFRYKPAIGMVSLGVLPGDNQSWGMAINGNGSAIVGYSENFPSGVTGAFYWSTATGMVELKTYAQSLGMNVTGWMFYSANGVSDDGTAVSGKGFLNGHERAFLITGLPCIPPSVDVPPIPTTICAPPAGSTGGPGTTAMFAVQADGAGPLQYAWDVQIGEPGTAGGQIVPLTGPEFADPVTGLSFSVAGWNTPEVTISNLRPGPRPVPPRISIGGTVINPCNTVALPRAELTVQATCGGGGCSLADVAGGGSTGTQPDGTLDGNDFIAFINSFAIGDAQVDGAADVAGGGTDGLQPDGTIDGSDFIAFINAFGVGC
jgi:probable HAF family extracellular repeat protein